MSFGGKAVRRPSARARRGARRPTTPARPTPTSRARCRRGCSRACKHVGVAEEGVAYGRGDDDGWVLVARTGYARAIASVAAEAEGGGAEPEVEFEYRWDPVQLALSTLCADVLTDEHPDAPIEGKDAARARPFGRGAKLADPPLYSKNRRLKVVVHACAEPAEGAFDDAKGVG